MARTPLGPMKISSRQGSFKPVRVGISARSGRGGGGIIRISLIFYNMKVYCVSHY